MFRAVRTFEDALAIGIISGAFLRASGPEFSLAPLAWIGLALWAIGLRTSRLAHCIVLTFGFSAVGTISRFVWIAHYMSGSLDYPLLAFAILMLIVLGLQSIAGGSYGVPGRWGEEGHNQRLQ